MNLSLRSRLLLSFLGVVLFVGLASYFTGVRLIHRSFPQVGDVLAVDLSAAREIFRQSVSQITGAVALIARQPFLREHVARSDEQNLVAPLDAIRQSNGLDLLILADSEGNIRIRVRNPGEKTGVAAVRELAQRVVRDRTQATSAFVFSGKDLELESRELAERARIQTVSNDYARAHEPGEDITPGLVVLSGAPVFAPDGKVSAVLCGGQLLNRQDSVVDRMRNTLYRDEKYNGLDVSVFAIFLGDKRIATSATSPSGERALGTLVSADVYKQVVSGGKPWINRSFVISDWYLTAYEPIQDLSGKSIGMLGLGLLERKFAESEKHASRLFLGLTMVALMLAAATSYALLNSILKPVNALISATRKVAAGTSFQELKLAHPPREIEALVQAFNHMQGAIKERRRQNQEKLMRSDRLAMIGQLASGVAHEINNPLGSILLFSRLVMQQVPPDGRMRENLERIEKETKRCHSIVQSLLDFARQREPKVEKVDVHEVVDSTLRLFETQYLFHNIEVVRNYSSGLAPILADQGQLQQVFMNIIINAVDAMKGKGRITLETGNSSEEGNVEISFTDTGSGIAPENINRIFDPFFTTKGVGHGTGLGLSVSYGIIQRHNGDITVSSAPGAGSTFTVTLPKATEGRA